MLITENLMHEHQLILKFIDLMDRYINSGVKNVPNSLLIHYIDFIREFADAFHHAKEEQILFRYLEVPGVLTHCNPVPQMLLEHNQARKLLENMQSASLKEDLNQFIVNCAQYSKLLKDHIYKEDNILYPMAERGLSDANKVSLLKECAETDLRLNSEVIWQKYETLYIDLENRYASLNSHF